MNRWSQVARGRTEIHNWVASKIRSKHTYKLGLSRHKLVPSKWIGMRRNATYSFVVACVPEYGNGVSWESIRWFNNWNIRKTFCKCGHVIRGFVTPFIYTQTDLKWCNMQWKTLGDISLDMDTKIVKRCSSRMHCMHTHFKKCTPYERHRPNTNQTPMLVTCASWAHPKTQIGRSRGGSRNVNSARINSLNHPLINSWIE